MQDIIEKLDKLVKLVKDKGDNFKFSFEDSRVIICCEIVRLELNGSNEISDLSYGAFNSISGNSYEKYRGIHDDIHELILEINTRLYSYNKNEFKADIYIPYAHNKEHWFRYFGGAIRYLLENK